MVRITNIAKENYYLNKAIGGNRQGMEYLVAAYQDLAYTIAIKIVLNNEDAEEVVQDAFLKAFASLSNFRKASKFSTWLYRIVYNTALTKVSTKKLLQVNLSDNLEHNWHGMDENIGWKNLKNADLKIYINKALGELKEDDRLIVTLHYIAEKSIAEIGEIMNLKKSAIKMRLLRGRRQLESELNLLLNDELKDLL